MEAVPSLKILFKDQHLAIIDKPAGLLVHRSAIDRHEPLNAMTLLRNQLQKWVYPVHRLDKPVSGVLVFALDPETARRTTEAFRDRTTQKTYHAIVRGHTPDSALIDYPLREELDRMTDGLADPAKPAQSAITSYRTLATATLPYAVGRYSTARYSLLEVTPITGRKHQIRRHLKHIFHPILGDTTHGDGHHNRFFRETLDIQPLLLRATTLTLPHPISGAPLTIHAAISPPFQQAFRALDWPDMLLTHPRPQNLIKDALPASLIEP